LASRMAGSLAICFAKLNAFWLIVLNSSWSICAHNSITFTNWPGSSRGRSQPTGEEISDFRFEISDFRFRISDFRFQISDFGFQISP
jgi:hypothetical protein